MWATSWAFGRATSRPATTTSGSVLTWLVLATQSASCPRGTALVHVGPVSQERGRRRTRSDRTSAAERATTGWNHYYIEFADYLVHGPKSWPDIRNEPRLRSERLAGVRIRWWSFHIDPNASLSGIGSNLSPSCDNWNDLRHGLGRGEGNRHWRRGHLPGAIAGGVTAAWSSYAVARHAGTTVPSSKFKLLRRNDAAAPTMQHRPDGDPCHPARNARAAAAAAAAAALSLRGFAAHIEIFVGREARVACAPTDGPYRT